MNKLWTNAAAAMLLTVLMPWMLCNVLLMLTDREEPITPGPVFQTVPEISATGSVRVLMDDGSVKILELEDYIAGVLMGEMPDSFHSEALKAQAVVARTYALRMREGSSKHTDADVCVRPECCQSYRSGVSSPVRDAVEATAGQVLTYGGELIEATYFASSGGKTEDALAVWGSDVPYLQSVSSPEGIGDDRFVETVTFTAEAFADALGISPRGPCATWFGSVAYTEGGGVETMEIAGQLWKGTELRKLLGIRSTDMTISAVGEHIIVTTRGFGHRVGMSQYGAEAMAVSGSKYDEILSHYYQGTTLELFVDKDSFLG